jgi:F5/8 type C domain
MLLKDCTLACFLHSILQTFMSGFRFWLPSPTDSKPYLTVDLGGTYIITGIDMQGSMQYFATTFYVAYSSDGLSWQSIDEVDDRRQGLPMAFASSGGHNITHVLFNRQVVVSCPKNYISKLIVETAVNGQ